MSLGAVETSISCLLSPTQAFCLGSQQGQLTRSGPEELFFPESPQSLKQGLPILKGHMPTQEQASRWKWLQRAGGVVSLLGDKPGVLRKD